VTQGFNFAPYGKTPKLFVAVILCLSGCQSDPWAFQYARNKPSQSIVGTYVPTQSTQNWLESMYKNVKPSRFLLRADSSFYIENVAAIWSSVAAADGFEQMYGHWRLSTHQDWWDVELSVDSTRDAHGVWNRQKILMPVMLIGQETPYKLHISIGDPDEGKAIQYSLK
jgi:hypothetical protein